MNCEEKPTKYILYKAYVVMSRSPDPILNFDEIISPKLKIPQRKIIHEMT